MLERESVKSLFDLGVPSGNRSTTLQWNVIVDHVKVPVKSLKKVSTVTSFPR